MTHETRIPAFGRCFAIGGFAAIMLAVSGCQTPAEKPIEFCDEKGNRYATEEDALKAGLDYSEFGATMCPEYKSG